MQTLRLEVVKQTPTHYQLRVFDPNNGTPKTRTVPIQDLDDFISQSQQHYATGTSLAELGKQLFNWLNGQEQFLNNYQQNAVLAITAQYGFEKLAWELLNNTDYLCLSHEHQPFTPLRLIPNKPAKVQAAKRPLRLLFMASSPIDSTDKTLDFEQEEARILAATRASNLELIVEESGSLVGLEEWIRAANDESSNFDVVHLTGHAGFKKDKNDDNIKIPAFVVEDEFGKQTYATADDIARVFSRYEHYPRLLFLSGCQTAQDGTALPCLCEALVKAGVPAVLGWATSVSDDIASLTAEILYKYLADGVELARAVAKTRYDLYLKEQKMRRSEQWHYLRLYSDQTPLTRLVEQGLIIKSRRSLHKEFLDNNAQAEVCPREAFVGRRRALQTALRILRAQQEMPDYAQGLQLVGVGGLGKSSLALRLCQRLAHHLPHRFVWVGLVDETAVRSVLCAVLDKHEEAINEIFDKKTALKSRLQTLFGEFTELQQALFIFDDFEQNYSDEAYQRLKPEAAQVIQAFCAAINQTGAASRVLITTRGAMTVPKPLQLASLPLDGFRDADLNKKTAALRLQYLKLKKNDPESAQEQRAIQLGAGNPRLLETLYRVLADKKLPHDSILDKLTQAEAKFRETLLLQTILNYQTAETLELCNRLALFNVFLPETVLKAVVDNPQFEHSLHAALAVGLMEQYQDRYLVSRLIMPLLDTLPDEQQSKHYAVAANLFHTLWLENDDYKIDSPETRELIRIAKLGAELKIFSAVASSLARYLYDKSAFNEAHVLYSELLPVQQALGDSRGEAFVLGLLALIHKLHGELDTALDYNEKSLALSRARGDTKNEGATLNNLATLAHAKGDYDTALTYLTQSLKIDHELGDKQGEGATLNNISQIYRHGKGDNDTALMYLTQSLKIRQDIGDKQGEGQSLNNISQIYRAKGDYDTALMYLSQSLKIRQNIGDTAGLCATLINIGHIHFKNDEPEQAMEKWLQAYNIAKQIGLAQALTALEKLAKRRGGEGLAYWEALNQVGSQNS